MGIHKGIQAQPGRMKMLVSQESQFCLTWIGEINLQDQGQGQKSGDLLKFIKSLLSMPDILQKMKRYREAKGWRIRDIELERASSI